LDCLIRSGGLETNDNCQGCEAVGGIAMMIYELRSAWRASAPLTHPLLLLSRSNDVLKGFFPIVTEGARRRSHCPPLSLS
ncbi:hypothetical protein KUCAC02_033805, partial [Chaenocephalus aceratus]